MTTNRVISGPSSSAAGCSSTVPSALASAERSVSRETSARKRAMAPVSESAGGSTRACTSGPPADEVRTKTVVGDPRAPVTNSRSAVCSGRWRTMSPALSRSAPRVTGPSAGALPDASARSWVSRSASSRARRRSARSNAASAWPPERQGRQHLRHARVAIVLGGRIGLKGRDPEIARAQAGAPAVELVGRGGKLRLCAGEIAAARTHVREICCTS